MKTVFLDLNGTPYENGKKSGEYFNRVVSDVEKNKIFAFKKEEAVLQKCDILLNRLKEEYPRYYMEVKGKAEGLNMPVSDYFALLCPELFHVGFDHCTSIICRKENGKFLLLHNEDDYYRENNFCMSKVKINDEHWFITNDMINMPFGNGFSWNSYGIVKTINYCHEENFDLDGLPRYFGQRHISEASSLEDLIKRCKEMKVASGFHVNALDIYQNRAVSVEVYPDEVSVKWIENKYVHTNHYIHDRFKDDPKADQGSNSFFRLEKASALLKGAEKEIVSIRNILYYRSPEDRFDNSIFQKEEDAYLTLANIAVDAEHPNQVLLDVFVNEESLKLPYSI